MGFKTTHRLSKFEVIKEPGVEHDRKDTVGIYWSLGVSGSNPG